MSDDQSAALAALEDLFRSEGKDFLPLAAIRARLTERGLEPHDPLLAALEADGRIRRAGRGYRWIEEESWRPGRVAVREDGGLELIFSDGGVLARLELRADDLPRHVMAGDDVTALLADRGGRIVVREMRVTARGSRRLAGRVEMRQERWFLIPEAPVGPRRIWIDPARRGRAGRGDRVLAEVLPLRADDPRPEVAVIEVLEQERILDRVLAAVVAKRGLRTEFPPDVLAAAAALPAASFAADEAAGDTGTDLRDLAICTIDGETAKDFDDAIAVRRTADGFEAVVAVADVSRYVREGDVIDAEALRRATSVYFPGLVLPMLPERLSNDLCSLVPDEDRPVVGVILAFDHEGRSRNSRLFQGWIRSRARLTYKAVNKYWSEGDRKAVASAGREVRTSLDALRDLAELRIVRRHERGALDFDLPEPSFILSREGDASDVVHDPRGLSHRAVEEMMIAANEAAARQLAGAGLPVLYRCHPEPSDDRFDAWRTFVHHLGLRPPRRPSPEAFQRVVEAVARSPLETALNVFTLRTMSQADYRPDNIGHFGLALEHYAHFTSPIRRYPDLVNHRLARHFLSRGGMARSKADALRKSLGEGGRHMTEREKAAEAAERDYVKVLKAQVMSLRVGEIWDGTVVGVASFGFFVEPDGLRVEGLVALRGLPEYFVYDEARLELVGRRSRQRIRLGDRVRVELVSVDVEPGHVDFRLLEHHPLQWAGVARAGRPEGE